MKFYYPNGKEILTVDEFISFYEKVYFYVSRNLELEKHIEDILKKDGKLNANDYKDILLWKTGGKIKEDGSEISYRGKNINIAEVVEVCNKIEDKKNLDLKKIIGELKKIDGVGNVIAITLIYFVMNDKDYPIYDRFAHLALLKIEREDGFDS